MATSELTQGSCLTVELSVGAERRVALDIRSPLEGGNFRGAHREARTGSVLHRALAALQLEVGVVQPRFSMILEPCARAENNVL